MLASFVIVQVEASSITWLAKTNTLASNHVDPVTSGAPQEIMSANAGFRVLGIAQSPKAGHKPLHYRHQLIPAPLQAQKV